jgi:hypothetical protein
VIQVLIVRVGRVIDPEAAASLREASRYFNGPCEKPGSALIRSTPHADSSLRLAEHCEAAITGALNPGAAGAGEGLSLMLDNLICVDKEI